MKPVRRLYGASACGLSDDQVACLAECIADSGDKLDLPEELGPFADSPSTGGPASLSTLLCPLLIASEKIRVPKLSASGSIAGAIDTMAIIPDFQYRLAGKGFLDALEQAGIAHAEPSANFCPADVILIHHRRKAKMMANPGLAAASLMAKKLAIPDVAAAFDFRVGPTGNIGDDANQARQTANLFFRVAKKLGVSIHVTLTDNGSFPCSAIGRLESLQLLWSILNGTKLGTWLDEAHLDTCVQIAARACVLRTDNSMPNKIEQRIYDNLRFGQVLKVFKSHLEAQGTSLNNFEKALAARNSQNSVYISAPSAGFWSPPDLDVVKEYAKAAQAPITAVGKRIGDFDLDYQFGLRLLVSPGDKVEPSQPLIELRYPHGAQLPAGHDLLMGSIVPEPQLKPIYVIEHLSEASD